jgi:hypothetical protein
MPQPQPSSLLAVYGINRLPHDPGDFFLKKGVAKPPALLEGLKVCGAPGSSPGGWLPHLGSSPTEPTLSY